MSQCSRLLIEIVTSSGVNGMIRKIVAMLCIFFQFIESFKDCAVKAVEEALIIGTQKRYTDV